jgi:formate hydrogenlyase subunit 4
MLSTDALPCWLGMIVLAPLLVGVINKTKALFAGRVGPPWFQLYYDLWKLFGKGAVYSKTTSWVFRAGPIISLAAVLTASLLIPFGNAPGVFSFSGDLLLLAYLLGLMRFFTVLAALDTGSSFEGMGASREVAFSALAEPALLLGLGALAYATRSISLSGIYSEVSPWLSPSSGPVMLLVGAALLIVFLSENARIPVDDPNTHLELTMIHEVMVLDHGGVDLAYIFYAAALKLWVLGMLVVGVFLPFGSVSGWMSVVLFFGAMFLLAIVTGIVESILARLRLLHVPRLLVAAGVLSALALALIMR